jgi:formiminotetrahydrofolate cyclodeaminase
MLTEKSVDEFISELASASPAPGGGSVAALAGALGAALTSMVCNLTIGKKKYLGVQAEIESVLKRTERLRADLAALVDEDTRAFNNVMAAFALPKGTEEEKRKRSETIQRETAKATMVPLRVMELCEEVLASTKVVAEQGNTNSISDAGVAALMLYTACLSAQLNVQINLKSLDDASFVRDTATRAGVIFHRVESLRDEVMKRVNASIYPMHS